MGGTKLACGGPSARDRLQAAFAGHAGGPSCRPLPLHGGAPEVLGGLPDKPFGTNWKMTAKTVPMQLHHEIRAFEHASRRLVLVVQDKLLEYVRGEFSFDHLRSPAVQGDSMHVRAYGAEKHGAGGPYRMTPDSRPSTDADGVAACLDLQRGPRVGLGGITEALQARIPEKTLFTPA